MKLMTKVQKEMISISSKITIHYIGNRKFRREMNEMGFGEHIKNAIKAWD